ncbi:MAG: RnfABCDGE type electron transport complex subunit D [Ignavibacteriales bacterium]|nr:RnfABCDGE type electron transport complex subunit D [Ignavibacteriales bacterium]
MAKATTNIPEGVELRISSSPHVRSGQSTSKAMWTVAAAIAPTAALGVYFFGVYQLAVIATCVAFALLAEATAKAMRKQKPTLLDGSAALTGLLLALVLPPNVSLVFAALGSVFGIVVGKEIFGGLGYNIFNPALVGRAFLQAAFPSAMTTWTMPDLTPDAMTSATPLALSKFGDQAAKAGIDFGAMFFGNIGGCIGETSALAIIVGGVALVALGVVNWRIPVSIILGVVVFGGLFNLIDPATYPNPIFHLLGGGLLFGAFFMASDWVTSPLTASALWIYGLAIALLVVVIRLFGGLPEGVMYAILIMNAVAPMLNRFTRPKLFGEAKKA